MIVYLALSISIHLVVSLNLIFKPYTFYKCFILNVMSVLFYYLGLMVSGDLAVL